MYECMHVVRRYKKETGNNHCSHNMPGVLVRVRVCMCQDSPDSAHLEGSQEWTWATNLLVWTHLDLDIFAQAEQLFWCKWCATELLLQASSWTDVMWCDAFLNE
jgi:hypothetical protein